MRRALIEKAGALREHQPPLVHGSSAHLILEALNRLKYPTTESTPDLPAPAEQKRLNPSVLRTGFAGRC